MSSNTRGPSQSAEGIAPIRPGELLRPEDQRICNDTYAPYFVNSMIVQFIREHPKEAAERMAEHERYGGVTE